MNLIPPEQLNFDNVPYISGNIGNNCGTIPLNAFKNSYFINHQNYFASKPPGEIRQNLINNNNNSYIKDNNLDSYNNQDYNKPLNDINRNNINNNIINNNFNNNANNDEEKKDDNEIEDPDEDMFRDQNNKVKEEESKKDDESQLSEDSEKNSDNEQEFHDHLLAQYEKVKRVKNKWKVTLKGCVVQNDNKEYICGKVHGELEREW